MEKLKRNLDILKVLSKCKKSLRTGIIQGGDRDLIITLCECVLNLLNGNINISQQEHSKLKKYKNSLRKLLEKKNLKEKKKILIQKGGFLEILLPAIISGLSTIISSAINSS